MREVAFPDLRSFKDFFPDASLRDCGSHEKIATLATLEASDSDHPHATSTVKGSGSMHGHGYPFRCFRIDAIAPEVLAFITENMIGVPYDTISFAVVVRNNGDALILAQYNVILGSRWLGLVDVSTLPTETVTA